MNVYLVSRTDKISWREDIEMIVIAEDNLHAERRARWSSRDFKKAKNLSIKKIDISKEQAVLISNMGA